MLDERKVIKKLQNQIDAFLKNHPEQKGCKEVQSIKEIIQMLEQEATEYNNGWIPCRERLPEHDFKAEYYTPVIVTLDDGRVAEGCYRNFDEQWWVDAEDGAHYSINATGHVVAWQPFPEKYEESEE